jgi:hypothetical protein
MSPRALRRTLLTLSRALRSLMITGRNESLKRGEDRWRGQERIDSRQRRRLSACMRG